MVILPYVFLLVLVEPDRVVIQPVPVAGAAECQALIELEKRAARPNVIAHCVPRNAALEISTEAGPSS